MALAVLVSVAAHAALWWLVRDALWPAPVTRPASVTPVAPGETVEFTIASPSPPARAGRPTSTKPPPARTQTSTAPAQGREATTEETAETPFAALGDDLGDGAPHPSPLPERGPEGAGAPAPPIDDAALVHARLADAARRCYPAAARRFRQQGTVTLSFCADHSGGVTHAAIKTSSGASLLDTAALGCVLPAAAPLPPEAASHCYAVPVRFDLQ